MSEKPFESEVPTSSPFRDDTAPNRDAGAKHKSSLRWFILLPLLFGLLGLFGGAICGFMHYRLAKVSYESEAVIRIAPRAPVTLGATPSEAPDAREFTSDHASLLPTQMVVAHSFARTRGLYNLMSFSEIPEGDVVEQVIENLKMEPTGGEGTMFRLTYRSNHPEDARTVLNNVIDGYREFLERQFEQSSEAHLSVLREAKDAAETKFKELQNKLNELEQKSSRVDYAELLKVKSANVDRLKEQVANLKTKSERVAKALESGNEEQINTLVWQLVQSGDLKEDKKDAKPVDSKDKLKMIAKSIGEQTQDAQANIETNRQELLAYQNMIEKQKNIQLVREPLIRELELAQEMLSTVNKKIIEVDPSGTLSRKSQEGYVFQFLQPASVGEQVWPLFPTSLGIGTLAGLIAGALLGGLMAILVAVMRR